MNVIIKKNSSISSFCHIVARGGHLIRVSPRDFDFLNSFRWFILKSASSKYAVTRKIVNGKTYTIRMHRLIIQPASWLKVHHINHNSLDNRRENLMEITEREHRHFDGWHIFYK